MRSSPGLIAVPHNSTTLSVIFSTIGSSSTSLFASLIADVTSSLPSINFRLTVSKASSRAVYSLMTSPVANSTNTRVSLMRNTTSSRRRKKRERRSKRSGITRMRRESSVVPLSASSSSYRMSCSKKRMGSGRVRRCKGMV